MSDAQENPPPVWMKADPSGSLRRHATWLNNLARVTFLTDKTHVEIFFLLLADGTGGLAQTPVGMDRDQFLAVLKGSIKEHGIFGVIHIAETWSYFPRRPNDHTMKQIVQGEIAVSELNQGDRTETLMVRVECRDGWQHLWLNPIVRTKDGVALSDSIELDDAPGGRFGTFFAR
jgi:hypothetical protein